MITEIYESVLKSKLGVDEVEHIKHLSKTLWKPTRDELAEIINKYTSLTKLIE